MPKYYIAEKERGWFICHRGGDRGPGAYLHPNGIWYNSCMNMQGNWAGYYTSREKAVAMLRRVCGNYVQYDSSRGGENNNADLARIKSEVCGRCGGTGKVVLTLFTSVSEESCPDCKG